MREDLMLLQKINERLENMTDEEVSSLNERIEQDVKSEEKPRFLVEFYRDENIAMSETDDELKKYSYMQEKKDEIFENNEVNDALKVNYYAA